MRHRRPRYSAFDDGNTHDLLRKVFNFVVWTSLSSISAGDSFDDSIPGGSLVSAVEVISRRHRILWIIPPFICHGPKRRTVDFLSMTGIARGAALFVLLHCEHPRIIIGDFSKRTAESVFT